MIILDFGSGNTCKNSKRYVTQMIDELARVNTRKHEVVIKWQLFTDCPPNEPLRRDVFDYAYGCASANGYKTTASVFDMDSLQFLLTYDIPFVKLANRPDLYWLAGEVPRKVPVFVSAGGAEYPDIADVLLYCVSKYPAELKDYKNKMLLNDVVKYENYVGISDHTTDFTLYHKYKPSIYECHYKLNDSTGLDAGLFARTPEQLSEIL